MKFNYTFPKVNGAPEQAVTQALSILGKDVSAIITSYIKDKYSVRLSDTADNPKDLSDALDAVIDGGKKIVPKDECFACFIIELELNFLLP